MRRVIVIIFYSKSNVSSALKGRPIRLPRGGQSLEHSIELERDLQPMPQTQQEERQEELRTISFR